MKTVVTRIFLMLLVVTFVLTAFAGCKEEPAPTPQSTETLAPREEELTDNLPEKDMEDFELRFYTNNPQKYDWADVVLAPEDYTGEEIYDTMFDRNSYISERFNCFITVTQEGSTSLVNDAKIQNMALSGDSTTSPHVVMHFDKWVMNSAQYFVDWNDVPYVSIGEEYWNPGVSGLFNIRDKQVAISGSFSLSVLSRTIVLLFNKDMYEDYYGDISSMYGNVTNNEWTIEKFYELSDGVVNNPDEIWDDTDQFGVSSAYKELYTVLMVGSDIHFLEKDETGILMFSLPGDNYAIDKMQRILQLCQDYDVHYTTSADVHEPDPKQCFENNRTLFAVRELFKIPSVRSQMEQEFGILPAPKYDTDQKEYRNISFAGEMACLLITVKEEELENIGILMEALSFDSQQKLIPIYKDKLLKTRFASDEDSRAMLDLIFNTTVSELGINVFEDIVSVPLIQAIYMPKKDVISSTLSGMTSVRTEISKMLEKIK